MSGTENRHGIGTEWVYTHARLAPHLIYLIVFAWLAGCSSGIVTLSDDGFAITDISVMAADGIQPEHAYTAGVCKGFLLSEQQVRNFFKHASYVGETTPDNHYDILPCYSYGTATINDASYEWVIRAGGIGEFTSAHYRFVKICGKNCCSEVEGIC